jgi:hypothetical protein
MTCAQDELAADGFQVLGERLPTTAKELLPVGTGPRVLFLPVGKYVDGDDFICFVARVIKRGVVGYSEVAPEPVYYSSHLSLSNVTDGTATSVIEATPGEVL